MGYQKVSAGGLMREGFPRPLVYLGGSCRGRDWRLDFYHRFEQADVTFINPMCLPFPDPEMQPGDHAKQVVWERKMLEECDIAVFWLGEGLANQASRVEIGYALGRGKTVLVGAEQGFLGMEHLSAFSGLVLSKSLDGLMSRFASLMVSYKS